MLLFITTLVIIAGAGSYFHVMNRRTLHRCDKLEQELHDITAVVATMTELYEKNSTLNADRFDELEERIMDLSVPSHDPDLPLERRHQVIALARQGAGLEDIVKRLNAPVGEAELILNLRNYRDRAGIRSAAVNEQVVSYA